MNERVNNKLRDLSILDFARFITEFMQGQTDIVELRKQLPLSAFDPVLMVTD